jgi:pimeloyl-ACP methyl ester carboxylesterase
MGAAVCLLVAAADTRVRAVVSDAAFARFDSAVEGRLRTILGRLADPVIPPAQAAGERLLGVRCIEIAPEEAIAKIAPRPVLLIHGGRDRLIRVENAYRLLRAARKNPNNRVSLWEVPSAGHVASIRLAPDEYARRVLTFLEMALTPFPCENTENTGAPLLAAQGCDWG